MRLNSTLLFSFACLLASLQLHAQTTFKMFDNELFIDGYANGQLTKYNDSLPPSAGVSRLRTSLVAKKFSPTQLVSIGNDLSMKVLIKASCDNYDRGGHVSLAFVPKGQTTYNPDSVKRIEIARFITPFMNKNKKPDTVPYTYEINNVASLLNEKAITDSFDVWCELDVFGVPYAANTQITGCAGRADVFFGSVDFTTTTPHAIQNNNVMVALGNQLDFNNYQTKATDVMGQTIKTITYNLPVKTYHTKIYLITSNHGAGTNGEEYNRRTHFVYADGSQVLAYLPGFESCEPYRKYNTQGNGIYGASPRSDEEWQSFSNWCPGAYIPTRIIHLGTLEAGTHTFKIEVPEAIFQGADGNFPLSVYIQGKTEYVAGVSELNAHLANISLYPNPVNGSIVTISSEIDVTGVSVYNAVGKRVLEEAGTTSINVESLTEGIYYVKVDLSTGEHTVKSFMKK
ncbi:MAG: peptide-N-glycosidase F-related protein [Bacteroidota bacterium]